MSDSRRIMEWEESRHLLCIHQYLVSILTGAPGLGRQSWGFNGKKGSKAAVRGQKREADLAGQVEEGTCTI
jgi:hypothetical protein